MLGVAVSPRSPGVAFSGLSKTARYNISKPSLCHFLAELIWSNYLTSLNLNFYLENELEWYLSHSVVVRVNLDNLKKNACHIVNMT